MKSKELKAFATGYANGIAVNPTPTGTLEITENDTYDVSTYAEAEVNVPNPSTGTLTITENDTYDVTDYAEAEVNVSMPKNTVYFDVSNLSYTGIGFYGYDETGTQTSFIYCYEYYRNLPSVLNIADTTVSGFNLPSSLYSPTGVYLQMDSCSNLSTLVNYVNSNSSIVGLYRFPKNAESVSLTNIKYIGDSTFNSNTSLSTISLPACTSVGTYAFRDCSSLSTISLPACASVDTYAFYNCTSLSTISLPACTSVGTYAFLDCSSLTAVYFGTKATSIASTAFDSCKKLTDIYVPWSEGEVANAPWGATKATIHYDYTGA